MKTNGFTKKKYCDLVLNWTIFAPGITLFFLFLLGIAAGNASNGDIYKAFLAMAPVLFALPAIMFVIGVLISIIGIPIYHRYAEQVINYNEDAPIEETRVESDYIAVCYEDSGEIKAHVVYFKDYDIKVRFRKGYDHPIFYECGGRIYEVVIPYTDEDDPHWAKYDVE